MKQLAISTRSSLESYSYRLTLLSLFAVTVVTLMPKGSPGDPGILGISDTVAHVVAYASVLFFRSLAPSVPLLLPSIVVILWGCMLELFQLVIGRNASLSDVAANAIGVFVGVAIGVAFRRLLLMLTD